MKTTECGICGGEAVLVSEKREVRVGKRSAVVDDEFFRCGGCGEDLYEPGQMDAVMLRASAAIRENLGLLMPEEIRDLRLSLDLTQSDFEQLLGVGEKTVVRWEKGTVFQNPATDGLLRALRDVEGVAEFLGARADVAVPVGVLQRTASGQFDLDAETFVQPGLKADDLGHFGLETEGLLEEDQYVPTSEERAFAVATGWSPWAAAA